MIESLIRDYKRSERDIKALIYAVVVLLAVIIFRAVQFSYESQYQALWQLIPQAIPLLSVLVVACVADRLLLNFKIIREDDRRQEVVRTTHHLIAITQDLQARVGYVKKMLTEGGRPSIAFIQIAKTIEARYETLLQRDAYRYLPGSYVDIIMRISGSIFGIVALAEGVRTATSGKSALALMPVNNDLTLQPQFDDLMNDLELLLDQLFELRRSIEDTKK